MAGEPTTQPLRTDVAVVGAGAAGLYAALTRGARGRARRARVALAAGGVGELLGAGRDRGRARRATTRVERHLERHAQRRAAASAARAPRACCASSPRRPCATSRSSASTSTPTARGALALGLEGGHSQRRVVHAGGSATGRRITRDLSALVATHDADRGARAIDRERALDRGRALRGRRGRAARTARSRPVLARGTVIATGGLAALWERTTNPRGAIGAGLTLAAAAGAELADLEFMQFHPTALVHDGPGARRLPDHRGDPRRGRAAARRRRRALRRRARAARRGGAGRAPAARGRRRGAPRHARGRPRAHFPNVAAHARAAPASTRGATLVPVAPGRALHDGRDRDGPRRRVVAARALRRRRVRLQRPARGEPAGVELARRVLRVRPPRRAGRRRARRPAAPTRAPPPERGPTRCRRARRARRSGGYAGLVREPATSSARLAASDPFPLARAIARCGARSRGEPRRPPAHRPPGDGRVARRHALVVSGERRASLPGAGTKRTPTQRALNPALT